MLDLTVDLVPTTPHKSLPQQAEGVARMQQTRSESKLVIKNKL